MFSRDKLENTACEQALGWWSARVTVNGRGMRLRSAHHTYVDDQDSHGKILENIANIFHCTITFI